LKHTRWKPGQENCPEIKIAGGLNAIQLFFLEKRENGSQNSIAAHRKKSRMTNHLRYGLAVLALLLIAMLIILPASAEVTIGSSAAAPTTTTLASVAIAKPFINGTISSMTPTVGDILRISGSSTGGNLTSGVLVWVFAGNYVNVTNVPVWPDGTYNVNFFTDGYPPAQYYVYVENPGPGGQFAISFQPSGKYSGQVVNTQTGSMIFNFTGTGSVQDSGAAQKLSDAINAQGSDDVYTKLTFQLVAPATSTPAPVVTTAQSPSTLPTATKSPLPLEMTAGAVAIGGLCAVLFARKP
jgi:hypothetical protein